MKIARSVAIAAIKDDPAFDHPDPDHYDKMTNEQLAEVISNSRQWNIQVFDSAAQALD